MNLSLLFLAVFIANTTRTERCTTSRQLASLPALLNLSSTEVIIALTLIRFSVLSLCYLQRKLLQNHVDLLTHLELMHLIICQLILILSMLESQVVLLSFVVQKE